MKKLSILVFAVALALPVMVSCSKEDNCKCTVTVTEGSFSAESSVTYGPEVMSKYDNSCKKLQDALKDEALKDKDLDMDYSIKCKAN